VTRWRRLVIEAAISLAAARLMLRVLPFRSMARLLRLKPRGPEPSLEARTRLLSEVPRAIAAAARRLPGESVCFPVAIAAQAMLRRRGLPTTLYCGAGRSEGVGVRLHAWLCYREQGIVGHEALEEFVVVARYP
jgi:hypothetical protein